MATFNLLHEKVQKYIYKQKWVQFRPIQDQAIEILTQANSDLLICAPTASGKTEAAFLPIVSSIVEDFNGSYKALYISPLKALINDQFKRVNDLCDDMGVPVTKWHGDVGQNIKSKSLSNPRGILLITPESLEAMLINKPTILRKAFSKLKYIVIDEIHSFVGTERGAQLKSIISRIEDESNCAPIKIALSATVGNPEEVIKWLSPNKLFKVIKDEEWGNGGLSGRVRGFTSKAVELEDPELVQKENEERKLKKIESIIESFEQNKNLIFANSKKRLEETAFLVKKIAKNRGLLTEFLVHHGSLSKNTREHAEEEIKESNKPTSIFCTSTLEMGIDIGGIEKVGILDPPWSVSGFAQRIGRSGRREGSSKKFDFYIEQEEIHQNSNLSELLREDLIKSIAVVQLYREGFTEPLNVHSMHLSTLVHQILSFSVQKMGASLEEIINTVFTKGFGNKLSEKDQKLLLDHLVKVGMLFKDNQELYSAGKIGEKLVEYYEFYSVFLTSEQWSVVNDGNLIGEIPMIVSYKGGDLILLGGRVWRIDSVIEQSRKLLVVAAKSAKAPMFNASYGLTHKKIHQKMKEVYESDEIYKYLDSEAIRLLEEGRLYYREIMKGNVKDLKVIPIFEGTVVQKTVKHLLDIAEVDCGLSECFLEVYNHNNSWKKKIENVVLDIKTNEKLASLISIEEKIIQKYDRFLPEGLLNLSYMNELLDIEGVHNWLKK